jgi:hypothetical protein
MFTSLSQRTRDLMQRALDTLEGDAADLITTLVASAFVDGTVGPTHRRGEGARLATIRGGPASCRPAATSG